MDMFGLASGVRPYSPFTGWFKVLNKDGQATNTNNATNFAWSLPKSPTEPGNWMPVEEVHICISGYHLTNAPIQWWMKDARLFVAEIHPNSQVQTVQGNDKVCVSSARLLCEIDEHWPWLPSFPAISLFLYLSGKLKRNQIPPYAFNRIDLKHANLYGADLSNLDFTGSNLSWACLDRTNLFLTGLWHANLTMATFHGTDLAKTYLDGAFRPFHSCEPNHQLNGPVWCVENDVVRRKIQNVSQPE